ncbi:hypothetical protein [Nocardioides dokdonensis]|nr:hypothetical protein [Nocardioides dokdonensis]
MLRTVLLVALALSVSSCGDIDAGDAAEVSFTEWSAEQPYDGVTPVVTSAQNLLPYSGMLDVTLYASDATEADVAAIREHYCAFGADDATIRYTIRDTARRIEWPLPDCWDEQPDTAERFKSMQAVADTVQACGADHAIMGDYRLTIGFAADEHPALKKQDRCLPAVRDAAPEAPALFGLSAGAGDPTWVEASFDEFRTTAAS